MYAKELLHSGQLYDPNDSALLREQLRCMNALHRFNRSHPRRTAYRSRLLRKMLAQVGENCYVMQPFYANWGGRHVHFGSNIYANFGLTITDDTHVYVGDCTQFGPNVTLAAAGHPILPELRGEAPLQYNLPIRIGKNCWLGAGVIVIPGVTIGDNSVIGAGSVVVRDIPPDVVAVGNPCRVLYNINEHEREYNDKDRIIDRSALARERK